tara:strand:+ start:3101 stop:3349 length:249 start_codon:yes stop_codon:yes gene_type:complete
VRDGFGFQHPAQRNQSVRAAKKSCSNLSGVNGVKCNEINGKRLSKKQPVAQKPAIVERGRSGKTRNNVAVSKSERVSKNVET